MSQERGSALADFDETEEEPFHVSNDRHKFGVKEATARNVFHTWLYSLHDPS